jgi:hypothetical protein
MNLYSPLRILRGGASPYYIGAVMVLGFSPKCILQEGEDEAERPCFLVHAAEAGLVRNTANTCETT